MKPETLAIVEAVCCENLSDTEAAMVFRCQVADIHQAIREGMRETGYKRHEIWQRLGIPRIPNFKYRRLSPAIGAVEKVFRARVDARNQALRRAQI